MISLFNESINKFNNQIAKCKQNIEEINNITSFLEVFSIENTNINNDSYNIINEILSYEETYLINDYSNLTCPCCKNEGTLFFHKLYFRNLMFTIGNYFITAKIKLIVLECSHCKKSKVKQHFHTLLPGFIFPNHQYSSEIILDSLTDKYHSQKIEEIMKKYKISYQLLYYWILIFRKYLLVCSVVLKMHIITLTIINKINEERQTFQKNFYQQYFHPFFLNKKTCVPLAITP